MNRPLVTAVIPAYGRPKKTQRAIDSVAFQTHNPIQLLVVDDGSTPPLIDSLELPEQLYRSEIIRLDENRGANVARNAGIDSSEGEFIAFLDSDDEWKPDKINQQIESLRKSDAQASYTAIEQVDSHGRLNSVSSADYVGDLRSRLLTGNVIGTFSSLTIERQSIIDVGKPNSNLPCWQDWEWYLRLSQAIDFEPIDKPLVRRHNEGDQISRSFSPKREVAYPVLKKRLIDTSQTPREERIALSHLDYHLGYAALVNDEFSVARRLFTASLLRNPANARCAKYLLVSGNHYPLARRMKRQVVRALN